VCPARSKEGNCIVGSVLPASAVGNSSVSLPRPENSRITSNRNAASGTNTHRALRCGMLSLLFRGFATQTVTSIGNRQRTTDGHHQCTQPQPAHTRLVIDANGPGLFIE